VWTFHSNFRHFENVIKIRETGNDGDVIWNIYIWSRTVFLAHSNEQTDENWTERWLSLLKFNYGFAVHLAQDPPKQAKNEIIHSRNCIFSACVSVYCEICLSHRETVRLNWKPWVSQQNHETWEVCHDDRKLVYQGLHEPLIDVCDLCLRNKYV